ncbi:uncharacterized protein isoform X2 [Leptinotarsa decemlineata]|uniref:uncharacterized protein isoform X2 n=1 Tax=Leptinotarsa decemlineata TaxID=7539 RepID=UPI003D3082BF
MQVYAESNESSSLEEEDIKEIAEMVKEKFNSTIVFDVLRLAKLTKDKCPDVEEKAENALGEIAECISDIELGSETFCSLIRNNWEKCSKPGLDAVASCLPEESKDLPYMFSKIIAAIVDEACNSTVEEILELFNPCGFDDEDSRELPECNEIVSTVASYKDKLPSKNLICSMLPKMRKCGIAQNESCKNPITKRAGLHFQEAIESATKDDCDALNKA